MIATLKKEAFKMKKRYFKKTGALIAAFTVMLTCLLSVSIPQRVYAEDYWPEGISVGAEGAIVMDQATGTVLYAKNEHEQLYPASITKVMTALLAIENSEMDETVTFSPESIYNIEAGSSSIARDVGEVMTMEQCLYGLMLESANECAYAIAEHVGSKYGEDGYETFINMMNEAKRPFFNLHYSFSYKKYSECTWTAMRGNSTARGCFDNFVKSRHKLINLISYLFNRFGITSCMSNKNPVLYNIVASV